MLTKTTVSLAGLTALLAGCASEPGPARAEILTPMSPDKVQATLSHRCLDKGGEVTSASTSEVVCKKTMTGGSAVLMQLGLGNAYSTTPVVTVRFTIVPQGDRTRVVANEYAETQMAFGQTKRLDLDSAKSKAALQKLLDQALGPEAL